MIIWIQRPRFPIKTRLFRARNTIFNDFCDNNVCACAVTILILLPVVNMSPKMDSATSISYNDVRILAVRPHFSPILAIFRCQMRDLHAQFRPYCYFRLKIWRHIWIQRTRLPIKTQSFGHATPFSTTFVQKVHEFYFRSQICRRKWIQRSRFPIRCEHFACKPTFKSILSKLVKRPEVILRSWA